MRKSGIGKISFSDFDLKKVKAEFSLKIIETEDLFYQVKLVEISKNYSTFHIG
ncbi:MAG: hypothetical protein AB4080_19295 [Trichodesmium sp.]